MAASHGRVLLSPSILSADFARLGEMAMELERLGADRIHLDVMDGHFVDNITFGPQLVESIRGVTSLPLEAHLMIERPEHFLDRFIDAGSDSIIIHYEAAAEPARLLDRIRKRGKEAGIAISPETPIGRVSGILGHADILLVMSVHPGFGGQKFIPSSTGRIREAMGFINDFGIDARIGVDGGVNMRTAQVAIKAGAGEIVVGSALFEGRALGPTLKRFMTLCAAGRTD